MAKRPTAGSIFKPKYRNKMGELVESRVWWLKFYGPNSPIPVRESAETDSWEEANRKLRRRMGEVATGRFSGRDPERIRLEQLFLDLLEEYRLNGRRSLVTTKSRINLHLAPNLGRLRAAEFTSDHIKRYIAQRRAEEAANATINRELELIKRSFTLASRCDPPKVVRVLHIPMLPEDNVRTGFLDDAGYLAVRSELPEHLRAIFVVAYHVGNRLGELRWLEWIQVDFEHNQVRLNPGTTKNKKGRTLPIYGEMREWLLMQKPIRDVKFPGCRYVFFQNDGSPIGDFRKLWASACQRAGQAGLLFHDLRRSAIRNMRLAGVAENVAMEISGHRTRSVFERYNIVSPRDLADAAAKMEQRHNLATGKVTGKVAGLRTSGSELSN